MLSTLQKLLPTRVVYQEVIREVIVYKDPEWMTYPKQNSNIRIDSSEVDTICRSTPGVRSTCQKFYADPSYKLVDMATLKNWLAKDTVNKMKYVTVDHDCDDFATSLNGHACDWDSALCFGIAWGYQPSGGFHAVNVAIGTDRKMYLIEPQTDGVIQPVDIRNWDITHLFFM